MYKANRLCYNGRIMELSQHLVKKGQDELKRIDPEVCVAELKEEMEAYHGMHVLTELVTPTNVDKAAPFLRSLCNSGQEIWLRLRSVIDYLSITENLYKSERAMCLELNINYNTWYGWSRGRSAWKFINLILIGSTDDEYEGRVHRVVADSAINGSHQDRRLYLELTKKITRAGGKSNQAGVNVIFIQDSMTRPEIAERSTIDVSLDDE